MQNLKLQKEHARQAVIEMLRGLKCHNITCLPPEDFTTDVRIVAKWEIAQGDKNHLFSEQSDYLKELFPGLVIKCRKLGVEDDVSLAGNFFNIYEFLVSCENAVTPNPDRLELDEAYLQMAEVWGRRSKSNRKQVGALLIKDRQIISDGYNGLPAGDEPDVCEYRKSDGELVTKPEVLHAESNALMKLAANGGPGTKGSTLYVSLSPCKDCAKLIHQAGISKVVYREQYRDLNGIKYLTDRNVTVLQLKKEEDENED